MQLGKTLIDGEVFNIIEGTVLVCIMNYIKKTKFNSNIIFLITVFIFKAYESH